MNFAPGARLGAYEIVALISTAGEMQPRWRADGGELFYVSSADMMNVDVNRAVNLDVFDREVNRTSRVEE